MLNDIQILLEYKLEINREIKGIYQEHLELFNGERFDKTIYDKLNRNQRRKFNQEKSLILMLEGKLDIIEDLLGKDGRRYRDRLDFDIMTLKCNLEKGDGENDKKR